MVRARSALPTGIQFAKAQVTKRLSDSAMISTFKKKPIVEEATPLGVNRAQPLPMQAVFEEKYDKQLWSGGLSDGTRSGFGSTLRSTTRIREQLPRLCKELDISSLLDAPCGDFHWMRQTDISSLRYVGGDIANNVIEELNASTQSDDVDFMYFDITQTPFLAVDAWLCRDCLIHLPLALCIKAMENFCQSNLRYVMLTHFEDTDENKDIPIGRYSPRNMTKAPFNLPTPLQSIIDGPQVTDKVSRKLAIWSRDQVVAAMN